MLYSGPLLPPNSLSSEKWKEVLETVTQKLKTKPCRTYRGAAVVAAKYIAICDGTLPSGSVTSSVGDGQATDSTAGGTGDADCNTNPSGSEHDGPVRGPTIHPATPNAESSLLHYAEREILTGEVIAPEESFSIAYKTYGHLVLNPSNCMPPGLQAPKKFRSIANSLFPSIRAKYNVQSLPDIAPKCRSLKEKLAMDPFVAADFKNGLYSLLHSCVPGYITWTCVNASYECCQASSDLSMVMIPYDSAESNDHGTGYLESYVFRDISYHLARGISRATPAELVHGIVGLAYVASGNSRDPVETVDTYAVGLTELCAARWLDAGIHPMFCHVIPAAIESGRSELEISLLRRVLLSQAAVNDVYDILNDLIRGSGVSYVAALLQYDPDHAVLTVARRIIGQIAPIADHAISSGNYWLVRAYFMNLLFFEWSPRYYSAKQVEATELMTWEGETSVSSGFDWLSSPVSSNTTPNTLASLSADLATRGYACGANVCKGGFCASGTRLLQSLDALYRLDPGSGPPNDLSVCQQLLHWYTFHETGSRFLTFATYAQEALNRALK